jgi:2-isopropylmalate synthase
VGIWASYNDISLTTKFNNKSRVWIQAQVNDAIKLAKNHGLKVRFTIEDASRTSQELIYELGMVAVNAGADRISLADTVGCWHPRECYQAVAQAVKDFPCEIEVHLHNDFGLAQANAIAAIDAGATVIDTSILGIGERAGICDLFTLSATLEKFYHQPPYNWKMAKDLASLVQKVGSFKPLPHHPIVGRHAFTHTSAYHIKATANNPEAYEALDPEKFSAQRKNILNTLTRADQQRFLNTLQVKQPFIKGASELQYHRDGVGKRWVLMDNRIDERSSVYIIERIFDKDYQDEYQPHVDAHAHHCDSVFVFMGNHPDGTGLTVSVTFGTDENETTEIFQSPASVFIPAHVVHSYQYLRGTGRFLNFVLSPSYNESLFVFPMS